MAGPCQQQADNNQATSLHLTAASTDVTEIITLTYQIMPWLTLYWNMVRNIIAAPSCPPCHYCKARPGKLCQVSRAGSAPDRRSSKAILQPQCLTPCIEPQLPLFMQ